MRWNRSRRVLVLLLSASSGVTVSCAFVGLMMPLRPAQGGPGGPPIAGVTEEARILFEACVIFYTTAYGAGRLLYLVLGSTSDSDAVGKVAGQHLPFLNLCASMGLVAGNIDPIRRGVAQPLDWVVVVIAGLWVPICLGKVFLALRRFQPFGWTFGATEPGALADRTACILDSIRHRDEGP